MLSKTAVEGQMLGRVPQLSGAPLFFDEPTCCICESCDLLSVLLKLQHVLTQCPEAYLMYTGPDHQQHSAFHSSVSHHITL